MAIKRYVMIPSKGGCFELTVGGKLVYSKLKTGRFPNEEELLSALEKLIDR
jgi:selenoprotein W-related protein